MPVAGGILGVRGLSPGQLATERNGLAPRNGCFA
jgi:hypothetical protein